MSFICSNWVSMLFSFPALMFPIDKDRRGSKWGQHQTFRFYIVWVIFLRFLTHLTVWNFTMTSASVELTWPKGLWGILPLSQRLLSSPEPKVHVEFCHDLGISWSQPDFKDHVRSCHHLGVCFDPDSCLMLTNRFV